MSTPWKVVLSARLREPGMRVLSGDARIRVSILDEPTDACLIEQVRDADGVLLVGERPRLTADVIDAAPLLKVACRNGAGYDNFDVDALSRRGIPMATTGPANSIAVAEHNFYLMIALAKRAVAYDRATREGNWEIRRSGASFELAEKCVLIVGFGRVGRLVAARCAAFDMRVIVADPMVSPAEVEAMGYEFASELDHGLERADFVSLCLSLTEHNRHLIGEAALSRMKPSAYLVNTSRGPLVDESALIQALREDRLAGAGLDVFETEPPKADNHLLGMEKVILTPHTAALNGETLDRMARQCATNVIAGLEGTLDPIMVVNRHVLQPT